VDAAWISRLDEHTQYLEYLSGVGTNFRRPELMRYRLGEGNAGTAALERRLVYTSAPDFANESDARKMHIRSEGFTSLCAAPLFSKGQVLGVLEVFKRGPLPLENEWSDYLEMLAGQASIAMDNLGLFDRMQRSHAELILAYNETIEGWSRAMDLRDHETDRHTQRVTEMSVRLATVMHFPESEIIQIRRGALLHDIGKMGVPDEILNKSGPLSPDEWELMHRHPQLAYDMLAPVRYLRQALDIPYCHHEKWDGSGYPRGLKGEEIPLSARIFAVVDVWDALRSDRPYRAAWPDEQVRTYIREQSGVSFDPRVVKVFDELLDRLQAEESIAI
jgi:HD-GYP domain-containing protein (c-di-GMP phosphodiesterase class II)